MKELFAGLLGILVGFIVLIILFVVVIYNKLVHLRNTVQSSWYNIDVWLTRRNDVVTNLLETVKGYAFLEQSVFEKVSEARSAAMKASSPKEQAKAENVFRDVLKKLLIATETYPELKADANFMQLQSRLQGIEENIKFAEKSYNSYVYDLNNLIGSFPSNIIASSFKFAKEEFFWLESPDADT